MNSRQRRKDKRFWKYSVKIILKNYDHYSEMWDWCKLQYGSINDRCGWRERGYDDYLIYGNETIEWQFNDKRKYVEFSLRWL